MSIEFKVPELGEGVDTAEVSRIYVSEGDTIEADDGVMELETEKAVADLPCPHAGTIVKIHVAEGDTIKVGQTILTLDEQPSGKRSEEESTVEQAGEEPSDEETETAQTEEQGDENRGSEETPPNDEEPKEPNKAADKDQPASSEEEEKKESATAPSGPKPDSEQEADVDEEDQEKEEEADDDTNETGEEPQVEKGHSHGGSGDGLKDKERLPAAGPATRRLARKLDIDLDEIDATGPSGRITQEDVVAAHDRSKRHTVPAEESQPHLPDFEQFGPVERQRLNKIARTAIKSLSTSWRFVPHVTQHDVADVTGLEAARRRYLDGDGKSGPKITLTAIAVKAVATILKEFPHANASLDAEQEELILKQYYHIGVAVDTEQGLLVPVVRDADKKSILELAAELDEVAEKARGRKLRQEDMKGATFTISNQGGIGGTAFTPIVNFPEVAILGISRARPEVQMADGQPEERLLLPLSLSYDHRVINGADAARFLVRLSAELSDCFQLLIRT
jgi:pyruvate dehydrogenase E2 component (dihydrolipoamide acetyltransferase)